MLARFFNKSEPLSFISLIFLLFIYVIIWLLVGVKETISFNNVMSAAGLFFFFLSLLFIVEFIIRKNSLTPLNYYASFIFVILIGLFPTVINFSNISISNIFILLALRRIYSVKTKKETLKKLYDSGFYVGIAFLLYPITIIYFTLIYVSYFIYLKIINKQLILPVLGFLTPLLIVFTYYFIFDDLNSFITLVEINVGFDYHEYLSINFYIPILFILFVVLWAFVIVFLKRNSLGREGKNSLNLVIGHLLLTLVLINSHNLEIRNSIQFLFFPISIVIGNLLSLNNNNWIKNTLLYSLLVFSLVLLSIYPKYL